MNKQDRDVALGDNATRLAKSERRRETAVLSVRLAVDEVDRLEALGRASGKTVSQVIRDAIAAYEVPQPHIVLSMWNGTVVAFGEPQQPTQADNWAQVEVRGHRGAYVDAWRSGPFAPSGTAAPVSR